VPTAFETTQLIKPPRLAGGVSERMFWGNEVSRLSVFGPASLQVLLYRN
jgi:hypothetical protein